MEYYKNFLLVLLAYSLCRIFLNHYLLRSYTPSLGYGFQRVITDHATHFPVLIYNFGAIATYEKQIILWV